MSLNDAGVWVYHLSVIFYYVLVWLCYSIFYFQMSNHSAGSVV